MAAVRDRPGDRRRGLQRVPGTLPPYGDPGLLAGLPIPARLRAVRARRAAVPDRDAALPPLAAGGLGRRGWPGRVGAGLRVRSHDRDDQPDQTEPGRCDRAGREHLQGPGGRRGPAVLRPRPAGLAAPVFPVPRGPAARAGPAGVAGLRGALIVAAVAGSLLIGPIMGSSNSANNL